MNALAPRLSALVLLTTQLGLAQSAPPQSAPPAAPAAPHPSAAPAQAVPPSQAAPTALPPAASPISRLAPPSAPHPVVPGAPPTMTPGAAAPPSMPPGMAPHPSFGPGQAPTQMPHRGEPPPDMSEPSTSVAAGSVHVTLVDENDFPLVKRKVDLITTFETIAEGQREERKTVVTNEKGEATFSGLSSELSYSYVVVAERDGGYYGVPAFRLKEGQGQNVRLHAYPSTHDLKRAFMGMRGFVFVQPREENFKVEVLFRIINMGNVSWLPKDVVLALPDGFFAFDGASEDGDRRFVEEKGRGARLEGTFAPGQHDIRFNYQLPNHGSATQSFEMSLPPHVAELRVIAESAPGMSLDVDDFEPAEPTRGPTGDRVLITRKLMRPGQGQLDHVTVRLSGLPVQGPGRWAVTALAALIALGGFVWAVLHRGKSKGRHAVAGEDLDHARKLLLDELVAVEKAHETGAIGPRTHEQARRQLLDALARLDLAPRLGQPGAPAAS